MSYGSGSGAQQGVDPALQRFIAEETEKQKMQTVIHELTEKCWDTCTESYKPSQKLDSRTENCMRNCVDRFLDTNILVTERLEKKASEMLAQHDSMAL